MPRIPVILAGLFLMALVSGVGGYFLLRPPEPEPRPRHGKFDPNAPPVEEPKPAPVAEAPKLVVLIVFDQMRGDYLARWADLYGPGGFERMKRDGIWFSDCHIPYACTSTGPGHASLSTGAAPRTHGIIENEWFDRVTGRRTYCCQPTRFYDRVPPLPPSADKPGRGAADGFSPERLLAQTVGESLQESTKGKGRVFSLSLKDRAAVLMAGQKPNGVYCFDTRDGQFHTGAFYGRDAAHPWVTEFNRAKMVDSWFDAKWERLLPEAEYVKRGGPDDAPGEADGFNGQGRTFPHALKGKLTAPGKKYYEAVEGSPFGNDLLLALAKKAITAENLGRGEAPDLLCVSFSSNDLIGHRWGPDSHKVMDATLRSDKIVADLLTFLDAQIGKGRYAVVLTADHGICPLPELASSKAKYPAAARVLTSKVVADLGAALDAAHGGKADWFETFEGGRFDADVWPWVYLNQRTITTRNLKPEAVAAFARDWLAGRPYMETAFTRADLEDGQFPADQPLKKAAVLAYRADRCGDVLAVPKPGVLVSSYTTGTSHGSPQSYDTHVPFLVYGAGVPALGTRAEPVSSLAVAPTLAWALGVPAPKQAAVLPPAALPAKR